MFFQSIPAAQSAQENAEKLDEAVPYQERLPNARPTESSGREKETGAMENLDHLLIYRLNYFWL